MDKNNNVTVFLQSSRDSVAKLKQLQTSFNALGGSIGNAASSFSTASKSMTESISTLNEKMTLLGISATLVVNSIASMAEAIIYSAEAQTQVQGTLNGTASAFDQLQARANQVKANFLGLIGNSSGLFMAFLDCVQVSNELVTMCQTLRVAFAAFSLEAIKTTVVQTSLNAVHKISVGIITMLTAVQKGWNMAIASGPIGLLTAAVSGLVIYLIQAYNTFEDFRVIVDKVWDGIKQLGGVIKDWAIQQFEKLSSVIEPVWNKLKIFLGIQEEVTATTDSTVSAATNYAAAAERAGMATEQLNGALQMQNSLLNTNMNTLGGLEQKISDLQNKQKRVPVEQAAQLEKDIELLKEKKNQMERTIYQKASGNLGKADTPLLEVPALTGLNVRNPKDSGEGLIIPLKVADEDLQQAADAAREKLQAMAEQADMFAPFQQGLGGIASVMQNLSGVVGESAGAWLTWGSSLLQSIAQAIPQIIALTNTQVASAVTQVSANTATAGTGAAASVASIPIVGWIMAGVAVASVIATLASLPKPKPMASGGIVYGNMFAQVGEYAGAANNPEVVAPLNKLRSLLQPASGGFGGQVEFVIKGNRLVGVLNKESNKGKYF